MARKQPDKFDGDPSLSMSAKKRSCLSGASPPLLANESANGSTNLSCRRGSYLQLGKAHHFGNLLLPVSAAFVHCLTGIEHAFFVLFSSFVYNPNFL